MSRPLYILAVFVATSAVTELIFHLSHFQYGVRPIFSEPFDLVNFTVKTLWWVGTWCFFWWAFGALGRGAIRRKQNR